MTDIRQDLSNNGRLSYIMVSSSLYKKILHNDSSLFGNISAYVGDENLFPKDIPIKECLNRVRSSEFFRAFYLRLALFIGC